MNAQDRSPGAEEVLVCFAVKEEAQPFERIAAGRPHIQTLLTGMGAHNAETAIRGALVGAKPKLVLTCGFAGGLRPGLEPETVVYELSGNAALETALSAARAQPARFHCADRVATTAAEKRALRESTGADAVEMESQIIRAICRDQNVRSATVRVILDAANQDLPLDFNRLMTPDQKMSFVKLAGTLAASPQKIPALLQLQKQSRAAAEKLALVLARALEIA